MKLALYLCKKDIVIYGRNEDGSPDICYYKNEEYLFCLDEKKNNVFNICDVNEYYIDSVDNMVKDGKFELILIDDIENFGLDELSAYKYKKLHKERIHYEEE